MPPQQDAFHFISLVHGEHSTVPLRSRVAHLRFVAALAREPAPLAVRLEVWTRSDGDGGGDAACLAHTLLPALRAAMPRVVVLDVRLPRAHSAETFAAAPRLRRLVLGVTSGAGPGVRVHPDIFDKCAPRLRDVRLQGMRVSARARPPAFPPDVVVDTDVREDRALTPLQLFDLSRGPRRDELDSDAEEAVLPPADAGPARFYSKKSLVVGYAPGCDVAPLLRPPVRVLHLSGNGG
ncbi:hypothetical protein AURDEDRAFT_161415, partial [Auricularia subglabra TFB-10046 SS5]